jgi:hypothetical protein
MTSPLHRLPCRRAFLWEQLFLGLQNYYVDQQWKVQLLHLSLVVGVGVQTADNFPLSILNRNDRIKSSNPFPLLVCYLQHASKP